jgi:hypothetical protein
MIKPSQSTTSFQTPVLGFLGQERRTDVAGNLRVTLGSLKASGERRDKISSDLRPLDDEGKLLIQADPIAPERGIVLGLAIAAPIWSVIGCLAYVVLS